MHRKAEKAPKCNFSSFYDEKAIKDIRSKLTAIMFDRQERSVSHNTIEWEENAFEAVKAGKDAIRTLLLQDADGELGVLSGDSLRSVKNNCICTICVLTRQVVTANLLDLETAFSLSDACIQCIEDAETEKASIQMTIAGLEEFADLINQKPQAEYHHLIKKAKEFVFKYLHTALKVKDIAAALGTNPDYLSRVFHKNEHITLHNYIVRQKLMNARYMLQTTEYSNDEIANYLGFSSQSHLQTHFKAETGLTLNQYRLKHNEKYRDRFDKVIK